LTGELLGLYDIGLYPSAFSRVVAKRIRLSLILMSTSSRKHSNVSSAAAAVTGTVRNDSATYAGTSLRSFASAHCSGANVPLWHFARAAAVGVSSPRVSCHSSL
jgi:hypothetical protein